MATQLSFDFDPPLVRTHTFSARLSIAPTVYMRHSRSIIEPPEPSPPDAGIAEMAWGSMLRELTDILCDAWMALREMLLSVHRHA